MSQRLVVLFSALLCTIAVGTFPVGAVAHPPAPGSISMTITIVNKSSKTLTLDGKTTFGHNPSAVWISRPGTTLRPGGTVTIELHQRQEDDARIQYLVAGTQMKAFLYAGPELTRFAADVRSNLMGRSEPTRTATGVAYDLVIRDFLPRGDL